MLIRDSIGSVFRGMRAPGERSVLKLLFVLFIIITPFDLSANEDTGETQFPGYYFELNDIVVNLTEGEERVYLMLNVGVSVVSQEDIHRLQAEENDLRESIQQLVRKMGREELSRPDGRGNCHQKLRHLIISHLPANHLKRLFLLNFILC